MTGRARLLGTSPHPPLRQAVDWPLSRRLARQIADGYGADSCWEAAIVALLLLGRPADACYVEGYLIPPDTDVPDDQLPLAHGWVERASGLIVDPRQADIRQAQPGRPAASYLAARRLRVTQVLAAAAAGARFPLMHGGGVTPTDDAGRALRAAALHHTRLAQETWRRRQRGQRRS